MQPSLRTCHGFLLIGNYTTTIQCTKRNCERHYTIFRYSWCWKTRTGKHWYKLQSELRDHFHHLKINHLAGTRRTDFDTSTPFELTNIPSVRKIPWISSCFCSGCIHHLQETDYLMLLQLLMHLVEKMVPLFKLKMHRNNGPLYLVLFTNTGRTDGGYGNVPGIINIQPYLTGGHNQVRIITWDNVPGNDYDLVGSIKLLLKNNIQ